MRERKPVFVGGQSFWLTKSPDVRDYSVRHYSASRMP